MAYNQLLERLIEKIENLREMRLQCGCGRYRPEIPVILAVLKVLYDNDMPDVIDEPAK